MLGPTEADTLGAESHGIRDLIRRISVGADVECAVLIDPGHQLCVFPISLAFLAIQAPVYQDLHDLGGRSSDFARKNFTHRSIDRNVIPLRQGCAVRAECPLLIINSDSGCTADAYFPHLTGNQRGVRGYTTS